MKPHLWEPHPDPVFLLENTFKPQKCTVCGLERYHQRLVLPDGDVSFYEVYWRNHRHLGEQDVPCVDWKAEDAKSID